MFGIYDVGIFIDYGKGGFFGFGWVILGVDEGYEKFDVWID